MDPAPMTVYRCECGRESLQRFGRNHLSGTPTLIARLPCRLEPVAVPAVPLADARRAVLAELKQSRKALAEAEKGIGSLLWVMNNRHNWADPKWDGLAESAEADARRALGKVRSAAAHLAGEGK